MTTFQPVLRSRTPRRRGSTYVLVLTVSMIVTVVGVSSLLAARIATRASMRSQVTAEAERLAWSAAEQGLTVVQTSPTWRSDHLHGVDVTALNLGGGTSTYRLEDLTDADLLQGNRHPIRLYGTGQVGSDAVQVVSVLLEAAGPGIDSLQSSLHVNADLDVANGGSITSDATISSNGSIDTANGGTIDADTEAAGTISGNISIGKASSAGDSTKEVPDVQVFDYYLANGTPIDIAALPLGAFSYPTIDSVVLSPASNPFGPETNPEGIYVIDCGSQHVYIRRCRIVGTLVLIAPGNSSEIKDAVCWSAAADNYPALMVQGDMTFTYHTDPLDEGALGANFNPTGTPYRGEEDGDTADTYPSRIRGLVYVSGELRLWQSGAVATVEGAVVCDDIDAIAPLTLVYRSAHFDDPPPGFGAGPAMRVVPGTWARADAAP